MVENVDIRKDMSDPYEILGLSRNATDAEIKKAYRKLAKELHPDLNPGDTAREESFKRVSAAYDLLGNPEKRRQFDAGEIDATGVETQRGFYHQHASGEAGQRYDPDGVFTDFDDFFRRAFRQDSNQYTRRDQPFRMRGSDVRYHLEVEFLDAVNGSTSRVTTPDGRRLDVSIPAGTDDGQVLRLKGLGQPGLNNGPPGDALIAITVQAHPIFSRDGKHIRLELPVSLDEAILGAEVETPTPKGSVKLRIPSGSSSGKILRLKGKGVAANAGVPGDLLVSLRLVLPEEVGDELKAAIKSWRERHPQSPRDGWEGYGK
ncbi:MAG: DnaJ C-terminal domain-containing protein [Pseudomonadota bacterium]